MARGGARIRSGPPPDLKSGRSDKRGIQDGLRPLPKAGYSGPPPKWPFPKGSTRERALWKKVWTYPQAVAWAEEEWRWLTIAHYVRWSVKGEASDASPSVMTQVLRLADSIGLSPAGLLANGWAITETEEAAEPTGPITVVPTTRRLRAVKGDNAD